jgi:V-type H+-transporting ATPase subunit d
MKEKLASELNFMKSQAVYPMNQFIEMMLHGYQIDNVVFVLEGLKSNRSLVELMKTCDPLGEFPELSQIQPIEGDDYASLYQNVLIDLPVGIYFRKFLNEVTESIRVADNESQVDAKFI